mmetsp:Transcript_7223/g.14789  ORF Transcript_7223/g.14789 Transcript_7223/m.14789 type:complete len:303 (+) Transcript_7223:1191-2099(+)
MVLRPSLVAAKSAGQGRARPVTRHDTVPSFVFSFVRSIILARFEFAARANVRWFPHPPVIDSAFSSLIDRLSEIDRRIVFLSVSLCASVCLFAKLRIPKLHPLFFEPVRLVLCLRRYFLDLEDLQLLFRGNRLLVHHQDAQPQRPDQRQQVGRGHADVFYRQLALQGTRGHVGGQRRRRGILEGHHLPSPGPRIGGVVVAAAAAVVVSLFECRRRGGGAQQVRVLGGQAIAGRVERFSPVLSRCEIGLDDVHWKLSMSMSMSSSLLSSLLSSSSSMSSSLFLFFFFFLFVVKRILNLGETNK